MIIGNILYVVVSQVIKFPKRISFQTSSYTVPYSPPPFFAKYVSTFR